MGRLRLAPLWLAALPAAALLASAACGGEKAATPTPGETPGQTPGTTVTAPAETATAAPTATATAGLTVVATPFAGTRGPVEGPASLEPGANAALLIDVRAAVHEDFDRIVFEFQGGLPGYRVEYVEPPILGDASGEPIPIAGNAFLRLRFEPAAAHNPDTGTPTYTGPRQLTPGLPSLVEAEETGDFEGVLSWVLGLNEKVDFVVYPLREPFRIAVDVGHPE